MTAAIVAAAGLALLGLAWVAGSTPVAWAGAVLWLPATCRLAADRLGWGIGR